MLILSSASPIYVIIFSGVTQLGWMISIPSQLLVSYFLVYSIIIIPVCYSMKNPSKNFFIRILNIGGLPPFSGFIIKLKAIISISKKTSLMFLAASLVALTSYSRIIFNHKYKKDKINAITFFSLLVGIV